MKPKVNMNIILYILILFCAIYGCTDKSESIPEQSLQYSFEFKNKVLSNIIDDFVKREITEQDDAIRFLVLPRGDGKKSIHIRKMKRSNAPHPQAIVPYQNTYIYIFIQGFENLFQSVDVKNDSTNKQSYLIIDKPRIDLLYANDSIFIIDSQ